MTFSLQSAAVATAYARARVALPGPIVDIRNPLTEDHRYLRFSLVPALLHLVAKFAGGEPYRTFEIGDVFEGEPEPFETACVTWMLALPKIDEPAWRDSGFAAFKGESLALVRALTGFDAETVTATDLGLHPGKSASLVVDGKDVATIGAVDPRLLAAFDVDARVYAGRIRFAELPAYRAPRYIAPSKYPPISRDLALVVAPHVAASEIEGAARAGGNGAIADVRVFDEYRGPQVGEGKKSIALRITLQRADATLTDAEADAQIAAILVSLEARCGAVIRA
jgi:phenylalanyl-tRNA synthetase beta chain